MVRTRFHANRSEIGYLALWKRRAALSKLCVFFGMALALSTSFAQTKPGAEKNDEATGWAQWRGPARTSRLESAWLSSADQLTGLKLKWRVAAQPSYSGPLAVGDRIYITETCDKKFEAVRALNRATGATEWTAKWEGSMSVPFFAKSNGDWIRSTPAYDDGHLYVGGMRDVLVCLKAADGSEVWRVDFVARYQSRLPDFGFVSSPLVDGNDLFVQAGSSVYKLDKRTGEKKWVSLESDQGMMTGGAFSSPVIATIDGFRQLIVQTREELAGLDLATGTVLWRQAVPTFRGMNILTPLIAGDRIFTSTYQGGSFLFELKREGSSWTCRQVWHQPEQGYMSSPILFENHVYLHLRNQTAACLELESGKAAWKSARFGEYWSMISAGDRILALDSKGELLLIRATPEKFELLDQRQLSEDPTWAHVGLSGGEILVRELNAMTVYSVDSP